MSMLEAHVNGNCMGDMTCPYCSSEPPALCEVCDGQGEVERTFGLTAARIERCPECLGTGVER